MTQRIRVFISSPGDVQTERLRASLVIDKLAQDYRRFFAIEAYLWEHEPMLSAAHFQDAIEPPSAFDIVVLILWSRLGTPLPQATSLREYRGADGRAPVTGTEWEYEDALRAALERGLPDLMVFRSTSKAPIDTQDPAARAQAIAQLTALDTFWRVHFTDGGSFRYAFDNYESLEQFAARLEEALRKVIERRIKSRAGAPPSSEPVWLGDPFRGLEAYEFEHSPIFFGRDAQIAKAIEQLARRAQGGTAFLLVSGASGSGKSSLVKAAVVPRLMKPQRVSGAAFARRACARAGAGGADPFLGLAKALTEEAHGEGVGLPELLAPGQDAAALAAHLRDAKGDPGYTFGGALGRLTESLRKEGRILGYETAKLVLVIDQLEELFTVAAITPEVRRAFVGLLGGLARSGHVWVIATLRADFWPLVAEMPELVALAEGDGRLDLAPPSLAEQAEIIRKPAAAAGLNFEVHSHAGVGLDATLAEHAAAAPGVLPLLSFTLDELYRDARRRGEDVLTYASYEALGGLQGAIAKRAEEVAAALPPAAQAALPSVLRALATTSNLSDAIAVSRSAALAEFPAGSPARQLVDAMIAARLLIAEGGDAAPTVRLAHEALIARWRRAADQLASDRRDLETRALAEEQFNRWRNAGRSTSRLLRNPDLANAVDLNARWGDELAPPLRDYIRQSSRRARLGQTLVTVAAALFFLVAAGAVWEWRVADRQQRRAEHAIALSTETANGLVVDFAQQFRRVAGVPVDTIRDVLQRARDLQDQLVASGEQGDALRLSQAGALEEMAHTLLHVGATDEALGVAQKARDIAADLAARPEADASVRRALAGAQVEIGDALKGRGEIDGALRSYRDSLTVLQNLSKASPNDLTLRRLAASSFDRVGDALSLQDDFVDALAAFNSSRDIRRALAEADKSTQSTSDLAWSETNIGDALRGEGEYDFALLHYRTSLTLRRSLSDAEPRNGQWSRDVALSLARIGETQDRLGYIDDATAAYAESLQIRKRLADADEDNVELAGDLAAADADLGEAYAEKGRYLESLSTLADAIAILTRLSSADKVNALWRQKLAIADENLGDVLTEQNRTDEARADYRAAAALLETLTKADPTANGWSADYAVVLCKAAVAGDAPSANFSRALALFDALDRKGALPSEDKRWVDKAKTGLAAPGGD